MSKLLVLLALFFTLFFGASTAYAAYDIKIGVYKNGKNLRTNIANIKVKKYKNSVKVVKKGRLYYAHAVMPTSKEARNALRAYKRIFKDAFISKHQVKGTFLKCKKPSQKTSEKHLKNTTTQKSRLDASMLLTSKTVYLCYDKSPKHLSSRVVKVDFSDAFIHYTPLDTNTTLNIAYAFSENKVVLNLLDMNITHTIDEVKKDYLAASNSIKDVIVYTLRYYFTKKDALAFIEHKR